MKHRIIIDIDTDKALFDAHCTAPGAPRFPGITDEEHAAHHLNGHLSSVCGLVAAAAGAPVELVNGTVVELPLLANGADATVNTVRANVHVRVE